MLAGLCLLLALELFMVSQLLCGGVAGIEKLYILVTWLYAGDARYYP